LDRNQASFGYRLSPPIGRRGDVIETPTSGGHRTPDFGISPFGRGLPALGPLADALLSLALTLRGRSLAFVRAPLSVIGRLLAIIGDSVSLIGDAISFITDPVAPRELVLTPRKGRLALVDLSGAASVGTVLGDHASP
jgi:hypothetical protein